MAHALQKTAGSKLLAADLIATAGTSYTPSLTAVTTNPNLGSSPTQTGYYLRVGPAVYISVKIKFGTGGAVSAGSGFYNISLPGGLACVATIGAQLTVNALDDSTGRYVTGAGQIEPSGTTVARLRFGDSGTNTTTTTFGDAVPWTWATLDEIYVTGWYLTSA